METTFTTNNERINNILNDANKVFGGLIAIEVGSEFTLPDHLDESNVLVRESITTYKSASEMRAKVLSEKARGAFHPVGQSGAVERKVDYLVIACAEGDLALGTLCSAAAAVNSTLTPKDIKEIAASSETAKVRGRAKQVLGWVEQNPGKKLTVTYRDDYTVHTQTAGDLNLTLTVFNGKKESKKGKKA